MSFEGAKLAIFLGPKLLVILRDDKPDIPFPAHWDLPGGGREGKETPQRCALRETYEEVGLQLEEIDIVWSRRYDNGDQTNWFFVALLPPDEVENIRFGDEGQGWKLMDPEEYCDHPKAVPNFTMRLRDYLGEQSIDIWD